MGCWHARLLRWIGERLARMPHRAVHAFAGVLATLPVGNASRRRVAAINIDLCFPELDPPARSRLLAQALVSNTTGAFETLRAWFAAKERLQGTVRIEGLDCLHEACEEGRGAVVVGAHYDSIELAMRHVVDAFGRKMPILVRRHNDACIEAMISEARGRYAGKTYDKKDIGGFASAVHDGHAVFYVPDQNAARRTVFVPFMGVETATLGAIGGVLRRTGGKVVLMWARRDDAGCLHIDLRPAWPDWPGPDDTDNAARYMAWIEARLRAAPEQYLWVHRRFKTRPEGAPPVY